MVQSIVTTEGRFRTHAGPEAKAAFFALCDEMTADDGGEHASMDCLASVARVILEEQGLVPIPEALPYELALAGRMVVTLWEYPKPINRNI
jgi:hypothetical protein